MRKARKEKVYDVLLQSANAIERINHKLIDDLGRDKQIGHSFLFKVNTQADLIMVWQYEILPLLEEYYYSDFGKITKLLNQETDNPYINKMVGIKGVPNNSYLLKLFLLQIV